MAVIIDEKARAAIARRRSRGRDATLFLRVETISGVHRPALDMSVLVVGWAPRKWTDRTLAVRPVGDAVVCVDRRTARYSSWHDVTISAWRLGPFDHLVVDPNLLLEMQQWERTHPAAQSRIA